MTIRHAVVPGPGPGATDVPARPRWRRPAHRRLLHPLAWWLWALGLAVAAFRTTNPFLLLLLLGIAVWMVARRRDVASPSTVRATLFIGAAAVVIRVLTFVVVGGGGTGTTVVLHLPLVPLPDWAGGIRLGGPVTAEGLVGAALDGARLATIIGLLGVANALASPRRLLRYLPAALDDVGTALVVALAYLPALAEDAGRVRRARRLRGHDGRGLREAAAILPVILDGALDRALTLAASMDSRGYGRRRTAARSPWSGAALLLGTTGVIAGVYGLFDDATSWPLAVLLAATGGTLAVAAGLYRARLDRRTHYRRDPWQLPETVTALAGGIVAAAAVLADATGAVSLQLATVPLTVPTLPWAAVPVLLVAALPGWLTPIPPATRRAPVRRSNPPAPVSERPAVLTSPALAAPR